MIGVIIGAVIALGAVFLSKGLAAGASGLLVNSKMIISLVAAFGFFLIMANHDLGKKIVAGSITAYILLKVVAS